MNTQPRSTVIHRASLAMLLAALALAACGPIVPGTPGHEPPSAGTYNPISGTNASGR